MFCLLYIALLWGVVSCSRQVEPDQLRMFDEFLYMVVNNGGFPELEDDFVFASNLPVPPPNQRFQTNEERNKVHRNGLHPADRSRQQRGRNVISTSSENPVHHILRDYIREQHQQVRNHNIEETSVPSINSANLTGNSSYVNGQNSSENSNAEPSEQITAKVIPDDVTNTRGPYIHETRRRHSRRHVGNGLNLDSIEESLRGIPRNHWSCCMLGYLAGDKGFSCEAQYYASRIINRNANRVHNRRLTGTYFDNGAPTESGMRIIHTFNSCVEQESTAQEFQGCCLRTLSEYNERRTRWRELKEAVAIR